MDNGTNKVDKKITPTRVSAPKSVTITFKEMRKYDLHVGRNMITFGCRESKKIPATWLKHPDFKQASKYFIVKGV